MAESIPASQEFQQIRNYLFLSITMFLLFVVLFESSRGLKAIYLKRRYLSLYDINTCTNILIIVIESLKKLKEFLKHHLTIGLDGYIQY